MLLTLALVFVFLNQYGQVRNAALHRPSRLTFCIPSLRVLPLVLSPCKHLQAQPVDCLGSVLDLLTAMPEAQYTGQWAQTVGFGALLGAPNVNITLLVPTDEAMARVLPTFSKQIFGYTAIMLYHSVH
jgi:hypothetical protein